MRKIRPILTIFPHNLGLIKILRYSQFERNPCKTYNFYIFFIISTIFRGTRRGKGYSAPNFFLGKIKFGIIKLKISTCCYFYVNIFRHIFLNIFNYFQISIEVIMAPNVGHVYNHGIWNKNRPIRKLCSLFLRLPKPFKIQKLLLRWIN